MLISPSGSRPTKPEDLLDARLAARLDRLDLRSLRVFAGKLQGERRSKKRGQSVEFDDYRPYVHGDDLRFIDWNVYARFDRLFVKLFLEEEDLALHVAIDASASMDAGRPSKLLLAARLASALSYIGLMNNNRVGLTVFGLPTPEGGDPAAVGRSLKRLPDARGRHHVARFARFLIDTLWGSEGGGGRRAAPPAPGTGFNEALTTIARLRVGKGVMVVLSDFLSPDGYEGGLKALAAAGGYDTYAVQILSPGEIDPVQDADEGLTGDLRLTDIESGRAAEVTLTPALIKRYRERLEEFVEGLRSFCLAREITHLMVRSDAEPESVLLGELRRRGLLG